MTRDQAADQLRDQLMLIAERARPVDLYERSLRRSAQIRRRRTATSAVTAALAVGLIALAGWRLGPSVGPDPVPPASPSASTPGTDPIVEVTEEFADATLQSLPEWAQPGGLGHCGTGQVTLTNFFASYAPTGGSTQVDRAYSLTLGGQPAYLVQLLCGGPSDGWVGNLAAYRKGADGGYELIANVLPIDNQVSLVKVERSGADRFWVRLSKQTVPGPTPPEHSPVVQLREYAWTGLAFQQYAGARSFAADVDLSVLAPRLVVAPAQVAGGCRVGTMTLRVRNNAPQPAVDLTAVVIFKTQPTPSECQPPIGQGVQSTLVQIGTIQPSQESETLVTVVLPSGPTGTELTEPGNQIQLRRGDTLYPADIRYAIEYL